MADSSAAFVTHHGSCHCGDVQFEFDAPRELVAWDCNCSICNMKRNVHTIVPASRFRLWPESEDKLSTYTFNTRKAKHQFCKRCGVQPFYVPRSNPDGFAITIYCIKPGTVDNIKIEKFDGTNWENSFEVTGITKYSKE
ncbi:hypothetical protein P43SY_005758 [Pythium insidiosum]|uniref:CENP-V/GFA domain-containing protein n=1 Tax=Pythium insidiosum TaxID=114742 RepID=A0AAD5MBP1_PYTIN|nr:hypothetical protein P43SY_005758 [Pythium insidiosum]